MKRSNYAAKQAFEESEARKDQDSPEDAQTSADKYLGLCSTCNYSDGCTLRKDSEPPVLFCEEFDSSSPRSNQPVLLHKTTGLPEGRMGLCMNCGKRDACSFQRGDGGIWSCEEYE